MQQVTHISIRRLAIVMQTLWVR